MTTTNITTRGQVQIGADADAYRVVCNPVTAATYGPTGVATSGIYVLDDFNPWVWPDVKYETIPWLFRPGSQVGPDQIATRKMDFTVLARATAGGLGGGVGDARQTLRNLVARLQRACRPRVDLAELGWFYSDSMSALTENDNLPGTSPNFLVGRYMGLSLLKAQQINLQRPWVKAKVGFEATEPYTYGAASVTNTTSIVVSTTTMPRPLTFPLTSYYATWNAISATAPTLTGDPNCPPRMTVSITGSTLYNPTLVAIWAGPPTAVAVLGVGNTVADQVQLAAADTITFDWNTRTVSKLVGSVTTDITTNLALGSSWFNWNASPAGIPRVYLSIYGPVTGDSGVSSTATTVPTMRYNPAFYLMG